MSKPSHYLASIVIVVASVPEKNGIILLQLTIASEKAIAQQRE
jgi:hypothetical protein